MSFAPIRESEAFIATLAVTDHPFAAQRYIVSFGANSDEAITKCLKAAAEEGWTQPKWWQFWRSSDSVFPHSAVNRM